jgi:uncharacterized membrane protein YgcG
VVLLPGRNPSAFGYGPVILVPPSAPPGHLPDRHHPLVGTWAIPVDAIPISRIHVAVSPLIMPSGMPSALWPVQPRHPVGPSLAPGVFQTGLDIQQARQLAAGTLRHWPGADLEATDDVGFRSWTVQHRPPQNDADAGENGSAGGHSDGGHSGNHGGGYGGGGHGQH